MGTFTSFQTKYGEFAVPAFQIKCGGTELKQSEHSFTEIAVDNCTGSTAGAARFTVTDVYERGSRQFDSGVMKNLAPGTKVSVSLGYGSEVTEVFTGYIDEFNTRFSGEEISLSAVCLDARGLMRLGSAYKTFKDKTLKDAVTAVFDKYGALITSKDVKLDAWETEVNVAQAGGDLDFVLAAADSRGLMFWIDCGKAYIGEAQATVCVEFDWEQFDADFSVRYLDEKIAVAGYDPKKMEAFKAESTAKQTAKQETLLTVENALIAPHYIGSANAKSFADAAAKPKKASAVSGRIRCAGLPEVKVGQKVKINKLPLSAAGVGDSFTVVAVSHRYDAENGFTTEIETEA